MAGSIKYNVLGSYTSVLLGAGVAPTLKNLANNTGVISNEIDNNDSTRRHPLALFDLKVRGASAFGEGAYLVGFFVLAPDGSNYADGGASVIPPTAPDIVFPLRATSDQQRISLHNVLLPNCKFKVLLFNTSGVGLTNTDNENTLSYRPYNYAVDA